MARSNGSNIVDVPVFFIIVINLVYRHDFFYIFRLLDIGVILYIQFIFFYNSGYKRRETH